MDSASRGAMQDWEGNMNGTVTATVDTAMPVAQVVGILAGLRQASDPGKVEDGTRVHVHYKAFGTPTAAAVVSAKRAEDLGLPRDRYTGRVSRIWKSKDGGQLVTLWVELERDHQYRTLNIDRGEVFKFVVLGD